MNVDFYADLVEAALTEDLGETGDVTSNAIFSGENGTAVLKSKAEGILAGCEIFSYVFLQIDPGIEVNFNFGDGMHLTRGDTVAEIRGNIKNILVAERTGINFLSYLSGIATKTDLFVRKAAETGKTVILDTRKTLPGYRKLAKYAVKTGGGTNHRMGLYDMVMIKDNHIDAAGSITEAVARVRGMYGTAYKVEVECRNKEEVREALGADADIIMLDNMGPGEVSEALSLRKGDVFFEVSGNMTLERIAAYASAGVDYISVGSLTHSVEAFDFSLSIPRQRNEADGNV